MAALAAGCQDPEVNPDAMMPADAVGGDGAVVLADAAADGMVADAAVVDGALADAAFPDAMTPDAMTPDAMTPDAMTPDAMTPDAMTPDAMVPDATPATCETSPSLCTADEVCVGEACSCIEAIHGNHYLRGDGTVVYWNQGTPAVVTVAAGSALSGVTEIYSGWRHGCARVDDGSVWCWPTASSGNSSGQLGNGSTPGSIASSAFFIATQVMVNVGGVPAPLSAVAHITSGSSRGYLASNTCAVRDDGTLWCWGSPDSSGGGGGTLFNDGVAGNRAYAVAIWAAGDGTLLNGVDAVSLGTRHACAIRTGASAGEVWCWGANIGGPLGQGDQTGRTYPVKVDLPGPADELGAGADATCARVGDAVYCWGSNNSGQVGIGDHTLPANHDGCINYCKLTPAQVVDGAGTGLSGVTSLNMAYLSACALRDDHTLWCWGRITSSQTDWAIQAVVGGTTLDNVAMHTTQGSGGYAQSMLYLTRDDKLMRPNVELTQVCP